MDTSEQNIEAKDSGDVASGVVIEALPNTHFRVQINNQPEPILAYLSGKMRLNRIRVMVGDKVEVLLDKYGGKGRITRRS